MKKVVVLAILGVLCSCQSLKIKDTTYRVSASTVELGALGEAKSIVGLKNEFKISAYPSYQEKIKVQIDIVPHTKKTNKIYLSKAKYNQRQTAISYIDSIAIKPELVSIKITDFSLLISELNAPYNSEELFLLEKNERTSLISSILIQFPAVEIEKIRQAGTHYLIQTDVAKYQIALYSKGKRTETLPLDATTILGYEVSSFCWTESNRGKWQIGDIVLKGQSCKGATYRRIKEKKEKSLYKM